jgi:ParB family chromosome partitioning protein
MGHAKALLQISEPAPRRKLRDRVIRQGLSVRATEKAARDMNSADPARAVVAKPASSEVLTPDLKRILEILEQRYQTRIRLKGGGKKGHLEIDYFDEGDLTRLIDLLLDQV